MTPSKRFKLNETDWLKVIKGAVIAGLAAALSFLGDALGLIDVTPDVVSNSRVSLGEDINGPVVDGIPPVIIWWGLSVLINLGRKWFTDNKG